MNPSIGVILPTYNRAKIVKDTIELLRKNVIFSGTLIYYVGIAGTDETASVLAPYEDVRCLDHRGFGLGANLNNTLEVAFRQHDIVFQMDDDHWLIKPLDLNSHFKALMSDRTLGWIRLMGIGAHGYKAHLLQQYWRIDWSSPELYIPSNRPHLKHRRFHSHYGMYSVGMSLGRTEEAFCHQCKEIVRTNLGPDVAVPLDVATESGWDHVGDSWQLKGF